MATLPKLSPRLQAVIGILENYASRYQGVWDCCCDHGYLGRHILSRALCDKVYFVDQLPHITAPLEVALKCSDDSRYSVITVDAGRLEIPQQGRQLLLILGVGGRAIVEILQQLRRRNPKQNLDFILCATNCVYDLRMYLRSPGWRLISEQIVTDRGREYELIQVSVSIEHIDNNITATGQMWDIDNSQHRRYQKRLLEHYHRQSRSDDGQRLQSIIKAYQRCFDSVNTSLAKG